MAQITLQPNGYGNFYGDSYGGAYAWCIGTQLQYDSLPDYAKASIISGYTTVSECVSGITASNPTSPVTIYILDNSTDISSIPSTINGQPVTVILHDTKSYNFNMYDPIPSQQKNIEGLRMPRYAYNGLNTQITTQTIDSNMFAILPYNCRMVSSQNQLTLEIVPICNDTDTSVLISIPGGNVLTDVPDFRAIKISGSGGYNASSVTYWS